MQTPSIPDGPKSDSVFFRWSREASAHLNKLISIQGARVNRTTRGMLIIPEPVPNQSASETILVRIKDVRGDYLICRKWDGTTEGATDIKVAKEYKHRESITAETIFGVAHTYTYVDGPSETWAVGTALTFNRTRKDDDGSSLENQRIVPAWVENEEINAVRCPTNAFDEDDKKIKYRIDGRSCQWAKVAS